MGRSDLLTCPMCGHRLSAEAQDRHCAGCPMGSSCNMLCCPRCGYRTVVESSLTRALGRLGRRWRQRQGRGDRAAGPQDGRAAKG